MPRIQRLLDGFPVIFQILSPEFHYSPTRTHLWVSFLFSLFKLLSLPGMPFPLPLRGKYLLSKETSSGKAPHSPTPEASSYPCRIPVLRGRHTGRLCVFAAGSRWGRRMYTWRGFKEVTRLHRPLPRPEDGCHIILLPGGDIAQLLVSEPLRSGDSISRAPAKCSATCWGLWV